MKTSATWLLILLATFTLSAAEDPASTLTKPGQAAPSFKVTTLEGKSIDLADLKGKVVLVNFFATWCGPCLAEMPHLEKEIWQRFKDKPFVVVAVGREHKNEELKDFAKKHQLTFAVAGDPDRAIYSKYATQYIPRNYLIGADGKIIFQEVGYSQESFDQLVTAIEKALK